MSQVFAPVELLFNIVPDPELKDFIVPSYGTPFSAALDVFAQDDFSVTEDSVLIDLGFRATVPADMACILLPRSGSGCKYGVALTNTIGLIDPDYTGTWMASMWLNGAGSLVESINEESPYHIRKLDFKRGEAICQMLFVHTSRVTPHIVSELSETVRGAGGFGSTDKR